MNWIGVTALVSVGLILLAVVGYWGHLTTTKLEKDLENAANARSWREEIDSHARHIGLTPDFNMNMQWLNLHRQTTEPWHKLFVMIDYWRVSKYGYDDITAANMMIQIREYLSLEDQDNSDRVFLAIALENTMELIASRNHPNGLLLTA